MAQLAAQVSAPVSFPADGGRRLWIAEHKGIPVGLVKEVVLWETLPFVELVIVDAPRRREGLGRATVRAWEAEMAREGHDLVMASSAADESAQRFWRRIGYDDCGSIAVRQKPSELFFCRLLKSS